MASNRHLLHVAAALTVLPLALPLTHRAVAAPGPGTEAASLTAASEAPVVVSGTVGDEATKTQILTRLREVYGANRVVDNLAIANVLTPPNWSAYVGKLLSPTLKNVSHGQLSVSGSNVAISGVVANEALRQQLVSDMATQLNPTYVIKNGLQVGAAPQSVLDQTLANRTIEFESSSAVLTPNGRTVLDQMVAALKSVGTPKIELIGHTDASGNPESNRQLSQARADAVKAYLADAGIDGRLVTARGMGSSRPIASNATPDGRARNRRIEFKVLP